MRISIPINECFAILDVYLPLLLTFLLVVCSHKGAVAVRQPYIRVVGIEEANEANSRGPAAFMPEEVSLKSSCKTLVKAVPGYPVCHNAAPAYSSCKVA